MSPEEFSKTLSLLGIRQVCDGCDNQIDPTVCHCGIERTKHDYEDHAFTPMGCRCGDVNRGAGEQFGPGDPNEYGDGDPNEYGDGDPNEYGDS